jgi:hypothetical protein
LEEIPKSNDHLSHRGKIGEGNIDGAPFEEVEEVEGVEWY